MINIIKIDEVELLRQMQKFVDLYDKKPKYIVMNNKTIEWYCKCRGIYQGYVKCKYETTLMFEGVPIANCNKLKFGEVEII